MKNFRNISFSNIKKGLLYRGESLYLLSVKDKKMIRDKCGIKVIVDLRTNQEHNDKKDTIIKGVKYIHLPLIEMEAMGFSSEKQAKKDAVKNHKLPDMFEYYRNFVRPTSKESWTKIFKILLEEDGPIMFHCTAGKDRTGIVIAIISTLLGASKKDIYEDYMETNKHTVIPFSYKIFALSLDKNFRKEFMDYFNAKEGYLDAAFEEIEKLYGGVEHFYVECCSLNEAKIAELRAKFA